MIRINGYPIDLAITETHSHDNEITDYPVEKGADPTDHIRIKPRSIEMEGVVSNTPIGEIAKDPSRVILFTGKPAQDAYQRLESMSLAAQPITLDCSLGHFENMGIEKLTYPRTNKETKGLKFSVTFKQMTFVDNNRSTIRTSVPGGSGAPNLGLSINKLVSGKHLLWRKGKPPGGPILVGQEIVTIVTSSSGQSKNTHDATGVPLNAQEQIDFLLDFTRDTKILGDRRAAKDAEIERRADAARRMANAKHDHPNMKIDKAMFGL